MPDALPLSELDLNLGAEDAVGRLSRDHGVGQVQLQAVLGPCAHNIVDTGHVFSVQFMRVEK
jgi:hypothetical protein